jgi:hypothetical protein
MPICQDIDGDGALGADGVAIEVGLCLFLEPPTLGISVETRGNEHFSPLASRNYHMKRSCILHHMFT